MQTTTRRDGVLQSVDYRPEAGEGTTTYWFDHLNDNVRKMVGRTATTTS
jgi:hypothetical protein